MTEDTVYLQQLQCLEFRN